MTAILRSDWSRRAWQWAGQPASSTRVPGTRWAVVSVRCGHDVTTVTASLLTGFGHEFVGAEQLGQLGQLGQGVFKGPITFEEPAVVTSYPGHISIPSGSCWPLHVAQC